jgi:hypothetical protein
VVRISPDVGRNRVIIQLSGAPGSAQSAAVEQDLRAALSRLRSPVDVLSDIRELETLEALLGDDFRRLGMILHDFGVRKVVRVVGKSAQAAVQMERISRQLNGHTAHLAFSMDEAEQVFGK